ncbi:ABC transporter permease [Candidatus Binatus sp.]|uniref:ABC transporter permease n=1 Tax=Candidatus Binatus sp. TaxID=2811406 RepID=UPI003BB1F04B
MNAFQLYRRYVAASIRGQMQYPGSFLMMAMGEFIVTFTEFVGVWVLFRRFGQIRGWTFAEIAMFYGTVNVSFAIADSISRGFDVFGPQFVKTGNFDRLLVRPRATILQLLGYELRLTKIGRLTQGVIVLAIATHLLGIGWDARKLGLIAAAIASGVALFVGILILQATLAFWTVESLEIANTLTYGGVEAAQYPLDIYSRWFRDFLIFVVPIGCVAYFPILRILGHRAPLPAPGWLLKASPLAGIVFLLIALRVWRVGVRHYTSTGT